MNTFRFLNQHNYIFQPFYCCVKSRGCTVYRGIFAPVLFSPLSTSLSVGEFKTTNFNVPNSYLFSTVAYLSEFKMGQNRFQVKKGESNMGQK